MSNKGDGVFDDDVTVTQIDLRCFSAQQQVGGHDVIVLLAL